MLVKEVDSAFVDALGNLLANLMGAPSLNHVQGGPSILSFSTRRCADKQGVPQLPLQSVLLDMVGHIGRDLLCE